MLPTERRGEGRGGEVEGDAGSPLNPASDDWPPSVPFEKPCMWPPPPKKKKSSDPSDD